MDQPLGQLPLLFNSGVECNRGLPCIEHPKNKKNNKIILAKKGIPQFYFFLNTKPNKIKLSPSYTLDAVISNQRRSAAKIDRLPRSKMLFKVTRKCLMTHANISKYYVINRTKTTFLPFKRNKKKVISNCITAIGHATQIIYSQLRQLFYVGLLAKICEKSIFFFKKSPRNIINAWVLRS